MVSVSSDVPRTEPPVPLPADSRPGNLSTATPDKRKRACMARRGQVGRIEVSGKWYVVRYWQYPAGKDRVHGSEKICPTDPKAPLVVGSAIDDNGELLFPRKWNHDFIDLPVIENQKQPTFPPETMTAIVDKAYGQDQVLYALLAGTGLRIGEALGLELRHISADRRTITVEQSSWHETIQSPKTKSAYRQIDVCPKLAKLLNDFIESRQSGFLFANQAGKPLSQTNVVRRSLHPILEELGVPKTGFHAMRRFRTTWLRRERVPEDLIKSWMGHSKKKSSPTNTANYRMTWLIGLKRRKESGQASRFQMP